MNKGELRRTLRLRRKELRQAVSLMRQRALARIEPLQSGNDKARRRRRRAVAVAALLVIAGLLRCECEQAQPPVATKVERAEKDGTPKEAANPRPPRTRPRALLPLHAETERGRRAEFEAAAPVAPAWIDEFRLQAAARSPRLAQCFDGTDRPGALRWVTALNPETGAVSDHELEPVGPRSELTGEQRACVVRALSTPKYRLSPPPATPFPGRVSLLIEF